MRNFTPRQLNQYLQTVDKDQVVLLDVREIWEYNVCHIEGSTLIPMPSIASRLSSLDKTKETVVICHHGYRSAMVARFLEQQGFDQVINLTGGVAAWAREVDASMPSY